MQNPIGEADLEWILHRYCEGTEQLRKDVREMKTKYIRDFRHNYLVVQEESENPNGYVVKMITENAIEGLIPCQERKMNGDAFLYYDITSRQSLQSILEAQPLQMCHLRKLFSGLKAVSEVMEKYLLNPEELLLMPEYVFADMTAWDYAFVYYPGMQGENNSSFQKLTEFFMQHMNSEDMKLVEAVYQMADLLNRQQFVLDEIITWFQENYEEEGGEDRLRPEVTRQEYVRQDNSYGNCADPEEWQTDAAEIPYSEAGRKKSLWKRFKEWIFPDNKWNRKGYTTNSSKYIRYQEVTEQENTPQPEEYGHTMFIPWVENSDNKLYGIGKNNKYHIPLQKLPITVGKLAGAVDLVLDEQSISRLHARISRDGNRFFITDLNSTNGTFRNGMRLEPNASEIIEPGDEIGIGKLKFIYR